MSAGVLTAQDVSERLAISMSQVTERQNEGLLFAVQIDQETVFPAWQLVNNGVVDNFTETMLMLNTTSAVGVFRFFQTYDEDLGCTPIDALKKGEDQQIEMIRILAKQFSQQVAR